LSDVGRSNVLQLVRLRKSRRRGREKRKRGRKKVRARKRGGAVGSTRAREFAGVFPDSRSVMICARLDFRQ